MGPVIIFAIASVLFLAWVIFGTYYFTTWEKVVLKSDRVAIVFGRKHRDFIEVRRVSFVNNMRKATWQIVEWTDGPTWHSGVFVALHVKSRQSVVRIDEARFTYSLRFEHGDDLLRYIRICEAGWENDLNSCFQKAINDSQESTPQTSPLHQIPEFTRDVLERFLASDDARDFHITAIEGGWNLNVDTNRQSIDRRRPSQQEAEEDESSVATTTSTEVPAG